MEATEIYVGVRKNDKLMNELGYPYHLNEGLQKKLRTVAMNEGIKKTEQKKRLEFYLINDKSELETLMNREDLNVLVYVDKTELMKKLNDVNGKYPRRMDYDTSKQYEKELVSEMTSCLHRVGNDENKRKKSGEQKPYIKLEVGKIYLLNECGRNYNTDVIKVVKTTEKTIKFVRVIYEITSDVIERGFTSFDGAEYDYSCDIKELHILGEMDTIETLRLSKDGYWNTKKDTYGWCDYLKGDETTFRSSYYFD